jgi:hypothetical protein
MIKKRYCLSKVIMAKHHRQETVTIIVIFTGNVANKELISSSWIYLQFLIGEFLQYLTDWKQSVATRPGDFSNAARKRMFLSEQTYEGIYQTG